MSLFFEELSSLTIRPVIIKTPYSVIFKNNFLLRLATLFLYTSTVKISERTRTILICERWFYVFPRVVSLNFEELSHLQYSFNSSGTSWGLLWGMAGPELGRYDSIESYSIKVVTHTGREYSLCTFFGEGAECTGLSGILLGRDEIIDFAGTQSEESRSLVSYLSTFIGIPLTRPIALPGKTAVCPACRHTIPRTSPRCIYCGARLRSEGNFSNH
jgi:hypothetical protein